MNPRPLSTILRAFPSCVEWQDGATRWTRDAILAAAEECERVAAEADATGDEFLRSLAPPRVYVMRLGAYGRVTLHGVEIDGTVHRQPDLVQVTGGVS